MRALIIGGTGKISMNVTKMLVKKGWEVYVLNRGTRTEELPCSVRIIKGNIENENDISEKISNLEFDTVCEFIGFTPEQTERDIRLFKEKTKQYIYISSASAYQKPPASHVISEGTSLSNPYWEYSRNKIACEEYLMKQYRDNGFPVTIVRPSHTYDERSVPLGVHGLNGSWQVVKRIMEEKPVIIHGDGTSLWTMTHSSDFAKGFVGLMRNSHAIGEAFQITSDEILTWNQIYKSIADALGKKLKPYYVSSDFLASVSKYDLAGSLIGDKSNSVIFDNSKLKMAVPEFRAEVRFDDGIRNTISYILTHIELQTEDKEFDEWCDNIISALEKTKKEIKNNG